MDSAAVEEIKRHFGVVVEGLRSDMRVIAEGQDIVRERLDRLDTRVETGFDRVDVRLDRVDIRLGHVEDGLGGLNGKVDGLTDVVQRVYSELTGQLKDHDRRLGFLEQKSAKGR